MNWKRGRINSTIIIIIITNLKKSTIPLTTTRHFLSALIPHCRRSPHRLHSHNNMLVRTNFRMFPRQGTWSLLTLETITGGHHPPVLAIPQPRLPRRTWRYPAWRWTKRPHPPVMYLSIKLLKNRRQITMVTNNQITSTSQSSSRIPSTKLDPIPSLNCQLHPPNLKRSFLYDHSLSNQP